jgi:hypothetical protein
MYWDKERKSKTTGSGSSIYFQNSTISDVGAIGHTTYLRGSRGKRKLRDEVYKGDVDTESDPSEHEEDDDSKYEEDVAAESSTNKGDNSFGAGPSFVETYREMDMARKWVLASGVVVEDVIFTKYKDVGAETLAHSWVIDLDDCEMSSLFCRADWQEISSQILALPQLDELMVKSMSRFAGAMTTAKLREVLEMTSYRPKGEPYNLEKYYDAEWVDLVVRKMLPLFGDFNQLLRKSHPEGWYDFNIWSLVVDHCMQDLEGVEMLRKESTSLATTIRKNRKRTRTEKGNHSKTGRRLGAIIGAVGDGYHEYGAIEVAKSLRCVTSAKWLLDNIKLAKALHDMLFRLHQVVDHKDASVKKLQVVGLVNSGLKCQVMRMNHPNGYVCLLKRSKLQEVPITVERLPDLFKLLSSVWQMKKMIRDCAAIVSSLYDGKTETEFAELTEQYRQVFTL